MSIAILDFMRKVAFVRVLEKVKKNKLVFSIFTKTLNATFRSVKSLYRKKNLYRLI